ncbi:hypothetical protein [Luteimonas aquatica]|uniref:hypothetical protein n=1 Tax=Luteimonas aquatica TaxID=450364 RepID=UPI001F55AD56|nr:hypothetical protein [Luteimonas aquatica]
MLALVLGLGLAGAAQAQTVGYNLRTGDVWVDNRLGEINDYGTRYRGPFVDEVSGHYGAPRSLVEDLLGRRGWAPGDVYYACAIARALGLPCLDIVNEYERDPGQGWGAIAKRHGIKPGSSAFHALKNGAVRTYDRWGYPIVIDRPVRVDWSQHGPGKAKKVAGAPRGHGKPARTWDDQDKPHGNGKGNGNKGGNGKGNNGKGQGKQK